MAALAGPDLADLPHPVLLDVRWPGEASPGSLEISGLDATPTHLVALPQGKRGDPQLLLFERAAVDEALETGKSLEGSSVTIPIARPKALVLEGERRKVRGFGVEAVLMDALRFTLVSEVELEGTGDTPRVAWCVHEGQLNEGEAWTAALDSRKVRSDQCGLVAVRRDDSVAYPGNAGVEALLRDRQGRRIALPEMLGGEGAAGWSLDGGDDLKAPDLPWRVTDATHLDAHDRFWVPNLLFHAEVPEYPSARQGACEPVKGANSCEQLVELVLIDDRIEPTHRTVQLQADQTIEMWNWEGIARWELRGRPGVLLATDTYAGMDAATGATVKASALVWWPLP